MFGNNYVGLNLSRSDLKPNVPNGTVTDTRSDGFHVYAGHDFTPNLAAEVFYADLGKAEIQIGTKKGDISYSVYGANIILESLVSTRSKIALLSSPISN